MRKVEYRAFGMQDIAVNTSAESPIIEGYAAVFNQKSQPLGGFREVIMPGAFAETILNDDIRALWNHEPGQPLGRTKNGTLTLTEDEHGLRVKITPGDTQWGHDAWASIKRGDVDQMSFGFVAQEEEWSSDDQGPLRILRKVKIDDVSPVTFPAYLGTVVEARDIWAERMAALSQEDDGADWAGAQERLALLTEKLTIEERAL